MAVCFFTFISMVVAPFKKLDCDNIKIGEHSFQRMFEWNIAPEDVIDVLLNGEVKSIS